jgi:hypothetical protein
MVPVPFFADGIKKLRDPVPAMGKKLALMLVLHFQEEYQ